MADANVDSVQQSQDAQNLDNLTSLQQADSTTTPQPTGGTADATVTTTNPSAPDTPSLYNDAVGTNNNQTNLEAAGTNSLLDNTTFTNDGRDGVANESPTVGSGGTFGTEVNTGDSQVQYTVTNEAPVIQGAGTNGTQNTVGGTQGGVAAEGATATEAGTATADTTIAPTDAAVTNTTPAPTLNVDGTPATDPTVDPLNVDPTPQEPVVVLNTPELLITKIGVVYNADGTLAEGSAADQAGDQIIYTLTITNTGNVTLTNVIVTDPLTNFSQTIESLAAGASQAYTTTYTLTQSDIDNNGGGDGDIDNTVRADSDETSAVTASYAMDLTRTPDLSVVKEAAMADEALTANEDGDVINYTVTVTNEGNVTLKDVVLSDTKFVEGMKVAYGATELTVAADGTVTIPEILVGGDAVLTYSYTVTQTDLDNNGAGDGDIDNTATATYTDAVDGVIDGVDSYAMDLTRTPDLSVVKEAAMADEALTANEDGDVINYTVTVTNEGNVTLKDVVLSDTKFVEGMKVAYGATELTVAADGTVTIPEILVGGDAVLTYSYTVTQTDLDNNGAGDGDIDNTATATYTDAVDGVIDGVDSYAMDLTRTPDLSVVKEAAMADEALTANEDGDVINYTVTVTNEGNVTLKDVVLSDTKFVEGMKVAYGATELTVAADGTVTIPEILVGGDAVLTYSYTVTQTDLDNNGAGDGDIDNTATATYTDAVDGVIDGVDSYAMDLTRTPDLSVVKEAAMADEALTANEDGDVINYTVTVTNEGNVTLKDVVLSDTKFVEGMKVAYGATELTVAADGTVTIPEILVGGDAVLTYSYTVTQTDLDNNGAGDGDIDNTATATYTDAVDGVIDGVDSYAMDLTRTPGIDVEKTAKIITNDMYINDSSDDVLYTITVTNTGNTTLTNVLVTDLLAKGYDVSLNGETFEPSSDGKIVLNELKVGDSAVLTFTYDVKISDYPATISIKDPVFTSYFNAELKGYLDVDLDNNFDSSYDTSSKRGGITSNTEFRDLQISADAIGVSGDTLQHSSPVAPREQINSINKAPEHILVAFADGDNIAGATISVNHVVDSTLSFKVIFFDESEPAFVGQQSFTSQDYGNNTNDIYQINFINETGKAIKSFDVWVSGDAAGNINGNPSIKVVDLSFERVIDDSDNGILDGQLVNTVTVSADNVQDTDTVINETGSGIHLSDVSILEGGRATIVATLEGVVNTSPLVITLSNGKVISIPVGSSTGQVTFMVGDDLSTPSINEGDDIYAEGPQSLEISINSVSGGSFKNLDTSDKAVITIADTTDITTVSMSTANVNEDDASVTFTATLSAVGESDVTVVTDLGDITITKGDLTGTLVINTQDSDIYKDADSLTATIESATGGNFEQLDIGTAAATAQIADTTDITTVSMSTANVNEDDASVTFTATLSAVGESDVTVVTDLGDITITKGDLTGTLVINTQDSDIYKDADSLTATIESATGGNFEQLDIGTAAATAQIADTTDITTVSMSTANVNEDDASVTFTATLSAVGESDVTVVTDLGDITITKGDLTGTLVINTQDSDIYKDADSLTATIESATGGNFEQLDIGTAAATAQIADTTDITTVSMSTANVNEDDASVTFTATLSAVGESDVTVVTDLGDITITKGDLTGTLVINTQDSDIYKDADSLTATIESATGGNFEQLDIGTAAATAQIADTTDITTVSMSTANVNEDDASVTFTATLSAVGESDVTVVTDLGDITITKGDLTGTLVINTQDSDIYKDADSLTATIESATGGNFEQLDIGTAAATAQIADTTDITTVSMSTANVNEDDASVTFTATLSAVGESDVTVVTDLGDITITKGDLTGTLVINTQDSDIYKDADSLTATIESATGGNFEQLDIGTAAATAQIADTTDITTVSMSTANVNEDDASVTFTATLSAVGESDVTVVTDLGDITITKGDLTGTLVINTQDSDIYKDADSLTATIESATGGNFEQLDIGTAAATAQIADTTDITTVSMSTANVNEDDASVTFTATLSAVGESDVTVVTDLGDITITKGDLTGTLVINTQDSDIYKDADSLTATIESATGGNFEQLDIGTAAATAQIADTTDITTVSMSTANVNEDDASVTFTATLSAVGESDVTVVTDLGDITITKGDLTGTLVINTQDSDIYKDADSLTATIESATGGNFEQLDIGTAAATAQIADTTDITTVSMSTANVNEDDASVTFTATLSAVGESDVTVVTDLGDITITKGDLTGTLVINTQDSDIYKDADSLTATIESATGGNFEQLDIGTAAATAQIADTTDITTVSMSTANVNEDDASVTFTATLSAVGESDVTVVTDLGDITITKGDLTGTLVINTQDSDIYKDADSLTATIESATGGNFEQLDIGTAAATAQIADTTDITTVSMSTANVNEDDASVTFTATLSAVGESDVTVVTDLGDITITKGDLTGTLVINTQDSDIYKDADSLTATIESATGGNFEQLDIGTAAATAQIADTTDITTVSMSTANVNEDDASVTFTATLSAVGESDVTVVTDLGDITITKGDLTGTLVINTQDSDIYKDADSLTATIESATGGNFEQLDIGTAAATAQIADTTDITTVSMSTANVNEDDASVTFTATLSAVGESDVTVVTDLGDITITKGDLTGTLVINTQDSDIYKDADSLTATIESATGGNFEQLDIGTAAATAFLDSIPSITVNVSATADALIVDETTLTTNASADFSDNFTSLPNYGADNTGSVTSVYTLDINLGATGLVDTITNQAVVLSVTNSGVVEGRTATSDELVFTVTVNASGDVTLDQVRSLVHPSADTNESKGFSAANLVTLTRTDTITDADGDSSTGSATINLGSAIEFLDDGPSITSWPSVAQEYREINANNTQLVSFSSGSDISYLNEAGVATLTWSNKPSGYKLVDIGSSGDVHTYMGTYSQSGVDKDFFRIDIYNSSYKFTLLETDPAASINSGNVLSGITGGSNLTSYTFDSAKFGGMFDLTLSATSVDSKGVVSPGTLTISANELGVNGNSVQEQSKETIKFDVVQKSGFENSSITSILVNLASTGSLKTGDKLSANIYYADGSSSLQSSTYDGSGSLAIRIDPAKGAVDYFNLVPVSNNMNFKITGVTLDYADLIDPADELLSFQVLAKDADGDSVSTTFSVNLIAGTEGNDLIVTGSTADTVSGGAGNDVINSDGGNDIVNGGTGADILTGGLGSDKFIIAAGDSGVTLTGIGNSGTISGYDVIKDFTIAQNDVLDLAGSPAVAVATLGANGIDSSLTVNGVAVKSHAISNGMIAFDDVDSYGSALTLTSTAQVAAVVQYLQSNDIGVVGATVAFTANIGGINHTYIYEQLTDGSSGSSSGNSILIDLEGLTVTNLSTLTNQHITPIALDLDGNGIQYFSQAAGIAHDYENSGLAKSTAWVAGNDGLLALDFSGDHYKISFSTQAGETDLQGLAKAYDSNKDGVLDAKDADFAKFGVWQDADSDGVVDTGEYLTLADRGITSLSLTSDGQVHFEANGDVIVYGQTTYTTADGELHIAEDVGFAVSDVYEPLDIAAIIANADAIESVTRIDQLAETDSSSSLMVELGGQTYEIATLLGQEVGTQDILSQFVGGDTSANLLTNKSWTDVIDIASDHGGPGAIIAAGGTLDDGTYANGEGDWTVVINSGDAKVDATNNQITFSSDSAENSVTITTADGSSHNIDNVDKIQWHG